MTDLEITRACAEAMGLTIFNDEKDAVAGIVRARNGAEFPTRYDPLHDDAQCFALLKKFKERGMQIWSDKEPESNKWHACFFYDLLPTESNENLNRAICECVAKMSKEKA